MNAFGPVQRNEYVEQELSCLPAPNGKETAHRDRGLYMRQVRVEGLEFYYCSSGWTSATRKKRGRIRPL